MHFNITKPQSNEYFSLGVMNDNYDEIDDVMYANQQSAAKVMVGATSLADGESGRVPAPTSADRTKYLKGDGTWDTPSGSGGDISSLDFSQLSSQQIYDLKVALGLIDVDEYDYAIFDGTGFFTTPYYINGDYTIEVTFDATYVSPSSVFGNMTSPSYAQLTMYQNGWYMSSGSEEVNPIAYSAGKHTFISNSNGKNYMDNVEVSDYTPTTQSGIAYVVGNRALSGIFQGKIYEFKITSISTGNVLYDLVPAMKGSAEGLYDRISGTFTECAYVTVGNEGGE